jgi:hypothetical protein
MTHSFQLGKKISSLKKQIKSGLSKKERRDLERELLRLLREKEEKKRKEKIRSKRKNQSNCYSDSSSRNFHDRKEGLIESDEEDRYYDSLAYDSDWDYEYFYHVLVL